MWQGRGTKTGLPDPFTRLSRPIDQTRTSSPSIHPSIHSPLSIFCILHSPSVLFIFFLPLVHPLTDRHADTPELRALYRSGAVNVPHPYAVGEEARSSLNEGDQIIVITGERCAGPALIPPSQYIELIRQRRRQDCHCQAPLHLSMRAGCRRRRRADRRAYPGVLARRKHRSRYFWQCADREQRRF